MWVFCVTVGRRSTVSTAAMYLGRPQPPPMASGWRWPCWGPPPPPPQVSVAVKWAQSKPTRDLGELSQLWANERSHFLPPRFPKRNSPEFLRSCCSLSYRPPHGPLPRGAMTEPWVTENSLCLSPLLCPGCRFPAAVPDKERQPREGASSAEGHTAKNPGRARI